MLDNYSTSFPTVEYFEDTMTGYWIVTIIFTIIFFAAMWKIFTKAGEKGWKAIIPVYNMIILFKISGLSPCSIC